MIAMRLVNGKIVRRETGRVTSCDDCGACCRHMGTPPGYAMFYPTDGVIPESFKESPDYERWKNLPPEVEADLRAYYDGVKAGTLFDRTKFVFTDQEIAEAIKAGRLDYARNKMRAAMNNPIPCLWYDAETKRCAHYENRPETCRDAVMVPGNEACLATRKAFRIPLPQV